MFFLNNTAHGSGEPDFSRFGPKSSGAMILVPGYALCQSSRKMWCSTSDAMRYLTVPKEEISDLTEGVRAVGEKTAREPFCMRTACVLVLGRVSCEQLSAGLTNRSSTSDLEPTEAHERCRGGDDFRAHLAYEVRQIIMDVRGVVVPCG